MLVSWIVGLIFLILTISFIFHKVLKKVLVRFEFELNKTKMEGTKAKILLCEDDTNLGSVLKNYLELNDYDVTLERDGRLGLAAFQREQFDLCLLDVMMPKMYGFDVCNWVKHKLGLEDVQIVMLTAKGQEFDRQKSIEVGADMYTTKPFDPDEILKKSQEVLGI